MKYIERLLQRQAQMAARLERQSAPTLRLYPEAVWLETSEAAQSAENEAAVGSAEIPQANASEEIYRQLVRLEAVREQRTRTAFLQAQEASVLTPQRAAETDAEALASGQSANMSMQEPQRQAFGLLPPSRVSQYSMERISRFFERDARRYGG